MTIPTSIHSIKLDQEGQTVSFVTDIEFEQFNDFAESFVKLIDSRIIQRHWGADRHQWQLEFEGCFFTLNYEFYADVCWLYVEHEKDWETLEYLASLINKTNTVSLRSDDNER